MLCFLCSLLLHVSTLPNSSGEIHVVGSPDPVSAVESKDVVLPCHVEPQIDMDDLVLEWTKIKQNSSNNSLDNLDYVHIYRDGHEVLNLKMASFVGRTSLLDDGLKHGNMSLRISNLTLEDAGRYRCYIPTLDSQYQYTVITLVGEFRCAMPSSPMAHINL